MARWTCLALLVLSSVSGAAVTTVDPVTGESTTTLQLKATPGDPRAMSIVIINTAAANMAKRSDVIGPGGGQYTSPPPDAIAQYGQPGTYNYGWTVGADAATHATNCTVEYADTAAGGAYAVIHMFSKDPKLPNMFGVSVNSNAHVASIKLFSGLFGDQGTTEETTFIFIEPPTAEHAASASAV